MKRTILLVILALCLVVAASAETVEAVQILGEVNGAVYENSVLSFGCKLEGWHYYSEDEIAQTNNMAKERMSEDLIKMLEASQPISVMVAQSADNTLNVNVQAQDMESNLAIINAVGTKYLAENSLSMFKQTLESAGFTDVEISVGEVTIGEETLTSIAGTYKLSSIPMAFKQVWVLHGNYLGTITITSLMTDMTDEVLQYFYLIP